MAIGWWNLVFCYVNFEDRIDSHGYNYGLRPVFTLKPGIKITGGNGTSDSPYTLGTEKKSTMLDRGNEYIMREKKNIAKSIKICYVFLRKK